MGFGIGCGVVQMLAREAADGQWTSVRSGAAGSAAAGFGGRLGAHGGHFAAEAAPTMRAMGVASPVAAASAATAPPGRRYDPRMTRIVIADDHPLFRRALAQAVREIVPGAVLAEAPDLEAARADLVAHPDTDLLLLDLHMPGSHGLVGLAALRAEFPAVAVAMISAHDDPATIRRALDHGAAGFISKSADLEELKRAIACVLDCRTYVPPARSGQLPAHGAPGDRELAARLSTLTPQQFRVLALVAEGKLNKQIADTLGVQERTVKAHLTAIFERLGARNRTQAGVMLRTLELADPASTRVEG